MNILNNTLKAHIENNKLDDHSYIKHKAEEFSRNGYTKFRINEIVPGNLFQEITEEVKSLLESHSIRRDITISTTDNTLRFMSNVVSDTIAEYGNIIPKLYDSAVLRGFLGNIANDKLVNCWDQERYIINKQEKPGDTHGWHWGDYPYTVIWIIEAPGIEHGGLLQCIPHTTWDKKNPRVYEYLRDNLIASYSHISGEAYFLKSDTTLHRVLPLRSEKTRIILNTCWASVLDTRTDVDHSSMEDAFV